MEREVIEQTSRPFTLKQLGRNANLRCMLANFERFHMVGLSKPDGYLLPVATDYTVSAKSLDQSSYVNCSLPGCDMALRFFSMGSCVCVAAVVQILSSKMVYYHLGGL